MNEPSNQTAYVTPELNRERLDAQWVQIAAQLPRQRSARSARPKLQLGFALAVVCGLLGFFWWNADKEMQPASVWAGALVTSDDAPVNFTLAEGTLIELEPRSEVELLRSNARSVQVSLHGGSARFDVAKRRTRRFSVHAGEVEVLVTGTQFRVRRTSTAAGERIRVDVEEGSVEVQRAGSSSVRLEAGERWSTFVGNQQVGSVSTNLRDDHATTEPAEAVESEPDADATSVEEDESGPRAAQQRNKRRARENDARRDADSAHALFERGNAARRLGRIQEAADAYASLISTYPKDHQAPLAAFELGRMRMDSLGDVRGAIEAFERAMRLDARRAFAEDALARIVLAQDSVGNIQACENARGRYLARYPDGVHAAHVATRCTSR